MQCIISRLSEPNIARLYPVEPDQNLVNNIRVLCTKYRETFCYFVPEEKFHDIRNGYTIPTRAVCCDEGGEWFVEIDPLKVISEQLREEGIYLPYRGRLEIRIGVDGYDLPDPDGEPGFLNRPAGYTGMSEHARHRKAQTGSGRTEAQSGRTDARSGRTGSRYGRTDARTGGANERGRRTDARPGSAARAGRPGSVARTLRNILAAVLLIVVIAGGFLYLRDSSVSRFQREMEAGNYREAVSIYNEKISGSESREADAYSIAESRIEAIESGYLAGKIGYEDACAYLGILTGIGNEEVSELAQNAKTEVELYESSSASYKEGLSLLGEKKYIEAIKKFLEVPESAAIYGDAQEQIGTCVDRLVKAGGSIQSGEEYTDALAQIDAALEILPGNSALTEGRAACTARYENLIRNSAVSDADALAASGDHAGALARIGEAMETLPDDERLQNKYNEYLAAYTSYIIKETAARVDIGDFEGAQDLVSEASQVCECEEFTSLAAQLRDAQDYGGESSPAAYSAAKVVFVTFKGKIKEQGKSVRHNFKTPESGSYRFRFSGVSGNFKVKIVILSPEGEELASDFGLVKGGAVNCRLEKGKKYTVEVTAYEGKGSYVLTMGQPKTPVDISSYDEIRDSIEYKTQDNIYRFVPGTAGIYRFDLAEAADGQKIDMSICDQSGYEVRGESGATAGGGLTAELHAGEQYEIHAGFVNKTGQYMIRIGRQTLAEDITGKSIVSGRVTFTGQKIVYTFVAAKAGRFKVTLGNMPDDLRLKLIIYDSLGYKIGGGEELGSGESAAAELEAGQSYQVQLIQSSGSGRYTMTVAEE